MEIVPQEMFDECVWFAKLMQGCVHGGQHQPSCTLPEVGCILLGSEISSLPLSITAIARGNNSYIATGWSVFVMHQVY